MTDSDLSSNSIPGGLAATCPKCGFEAPPDIGPFSDCPSCGVIVAKLRSADAATSALYPGPPDESGHHESDVSAPSGADLEAAPAPTADTRLHAGEDGLYDPDAVAAVGSMPERPEHRDARISPTFSELRRRNRQTEVASGFDHEVRWGMAIGVIVFAIPFTRYLMSFLSILVHETGHTLTGWLFGYPTIPSFDFVNHGGVSVYFFRLETLTVVIAGVVVLWLWQARGHRRIQLLALSILIVYLVLNWTRLHQLMFDAMGHGGELVFAAIFLYRGFAPAFRVDGLERPAFAAAGTFLTLHHIAFAWALATSEDRRQEYQRGIRGFTHDLERLAQWTGVPLGLVALLLALTAIAVPLIAWLAHTNRSRLRESWEALMSP